MVVARLEEELAVRELAVRTAERAGSAGELGDRRIEDVFEVELERSGLERDVVREMEIRLDAVPAEEDILPLTPAERFEVTALGVERVDIEMLERLLIVGAAGRERIVLRLSVAEGRLVLRLGAAAERLMLRLGVAGERAVRLPSAGAECAGVERLARCADEELARLVRWEAGLREEGRWAAWVLASAAAAASNPRIEMNTMNPVLLLRWGDVDDIACLAMTTSFRLPVFVNPGSGPYRPIGLSDALCSN